ncbi:MAG: phage holin family protein [Novosphingobium sp.]|nr:phage holin family protein [Novosphingobium sp.]
MAEAETRTASAEAETGTDDDARERSLVEDLRKLAGDGRAFAEAEIAYQRARVAYAGAAARPIAALGALALCFVFFALMAATVGSVIALAPRLGAWGATGAVAGGLILLAALCALVARQKAGTMVRTLKQGGRP